MSVTVRVIPGAVEVLENDTSICKGDAVPISIPSKYSDIRWQDGGSENDVSLTDAGHYWVDIIDKHCISGDTMMLDVRLCTCEAIIPNSFTPNGDGLNEVFMPVYSCPVFDFQLFIHNRWGELVFESVNEEIGWNGNTDNISGSDGLFAFKITYSLADGSNHSHKGTLILIR